MLRNPEIDSWAKRLSKGTGFHVGIVLAIWDNLGELTPRTGTTLKDAVLERKALVHATLTSMSSKDKQVLRTLGLWTGG